MDSLKTNLRELHQKYEDTLALLSKFNEKNDEINGKIDEIGVHYASWRDKKLNGEKKSKKKGKGPLAGCLNEDDLNILEVSCYFILQCSLINKHI